MYNLRIRKYQLGKSGIKLILLSDLHNSAYGWILTQVEAQIPDIIAVTGDMTYDFEQYDRAVSFLKACARIAPTFVSLGNHDRADVYTGMDLEEAVLLHNGFADITIRGIPLRIGGLSSPASGYRGKDVPVKYKWNTQWLDRFCNTVTYKILLCH